MTKYNERWYKTNVLNAAGENWSGIEPVQNVKLKNPINTNGEREQDRKLFTAKKPLTITEE